MAMICSYTSKRDSSKWAWNIILRLNSDIPQGYLMLILYSAISAIGEHLHGTTIVSNLALKLFVIT
jgi:hypothetical protein